MRLRAQGIDGDNGGVGRVRRSHRLSNNDGGVRKGQGTYNASKGSETTTEVAEARRRYQGIYDDNGGVSRGR